jgi:secretion/DNA translocation related TadE-like protein
VTGRCTGVRGERGAASLFAVACLAMLLVVGAALDVVAAMVHAHRVAQSAADLVALAAASAVADGADGCAAAARIATANGASLAACRVDDRDVAVTVTVDGPRWLGQSGDLAAQARAGPA